MPFPLRFSLFFQRLIRSLPWHVSLVISVILFLIFHHLAGRSLQAPADQLWLTTLLQSMQWLLPLGGLMLSVLSFWKLHTSKSAAQLRRQLKSTQALNSQAFEHLCAQFFRARGYRVTLLLSDEHPSSTLLSLMMGNTSYLARYQYWQPSMLLADMITELHTDMQHHRAKGGFLVVEELPEHSVHLAKLLSPGITLIAVNEIFQHAKEYDETMG